MGSKNELLDDLQDELIPKTEPIDVDSIKKEEIEEEFFVAPGILESFKVDKDLVKDEIFVNVGIEPYPESSGVKDEEGEPCSSLNVRIICLIIISYSFKNQVSTYNFPGTPIYCKNCLSYKGENCMLCNHSSTSAIPLCLEASTFFLTRKMFGKYILAIQNIFIIGMS